MNKPFNFLTVAALLSLGLSLSSCDDDGTEADRKGIGASCAKSEDCSEKGQVCLPFKGGYCGVVDCADNAGCPSGSACVKHDDGKNYCFRVCVEKIDCNANRPVESESNCSSKTSPVSGGKETKVCVPPSGS